MLTGSFFAPSEIANRFETACWVEILAGDPTLSGSLSGAVIT